MKEKLSACYAALSSDDENEVPMDYGEVVMGGATFRFANFESHFIRVQIFQIDF